MRFIKYLSRNALAFDKCYATGIISDLSAFIWLDLDFFVFVFLFFILFNCPVYTKTGDVLFMSLRTNLQVACVHVSKDSQGSLRGVAVTYSDNCRYRLEEAVFCWCVCYL